MTALNYRLIPNLRPCNPIGCLLTSPKCSTFNETLWMDHQGGWGKRFCKQHFWQRHKVILHFERLSWAHSAELLGHMRGEGGGWKGLGAFFVLKCFSANFVET